jgi:glycosyltransferase EpsJ
MRFFWFPVTKVYNASLLNKIRFNSNINIGEDTIFNIEAMANSSKVLTIDECLYNYVFNKGSLTSIKFRPDLLNNMEAHYKARLVIHEKFKELKANIFYKDISKYYINHILFWLLKNIRNSPDDFNKVQELKNIRSSIIYNDCFQNYFYKWEHPKRSLIIKLFEIRKFNILLKFLK